MFNPGRSVRGCSLKAMALALGIWGLSSQPALAQSGAGSPGYIDATGLAVSPVYYGPPPGVFGPGYPGFGLDYGCDGRCLPHRQTMRKSSIHAWGSYVLGKECLYPYVADPYSDPVGAMVPWPPYSAPVAGAPR